MMGKIKKVITREEKEKKIKELLELEKFKQHLEQEKQIIEDEMIKKAELTQEDINKLVIIMAKEKGLLLNNGKG
jgi:glutaminase